MLGKLGPGWPDFPPRHVIPGAESSDPFDRYRDSAVIPAKAGTQGWVPAFAGMTGGLVRTFATWYHPSISTIRRTFRLLAPSMPVSRSTFTALPPQPS